MITYTDKNIYWNYFISIEDDLKGLSRFIEFDRRNEDVFSIELVRLLITASSEFEVVAKELIKIKDPSKETKNMNIIDIKDNVLVFYPEICDLEIIVLRFGLSYKPLLKWKNNEGCDWWASYNNVKHERNNKYEDGNLKNVMDAVGALYIINLFYYKALQEKIENKSINMEEITLKLKPIPSLIKINRVDYYMIPYSISYMD